uniref:Ig-like domain-containing protein n=1 Tax=Oreochromis aureus TaxID=47969 RepID=A0AAZ1X4D5_OREAU
HTLWSLIISTFHCISVLTRQIILFITSSLFTKIITAASGQNVTLTCRAPNSNNIIVVEWSRADLETEYVLLYRNKKLDPENQHPSFKNRVDLQDRQMKDGDVSLILNNVTTADNGTYECRIFMRERQRRKRAHLKTDPITDTSHLFLTCRSDRRRHRGWICWTESWSNCSCCGGCCYWCCCSCCCCCWFCDLQKP